jgi:signal peptidase II
MKKKIGWVIFIAIFVGLDQWSKHWIEGNFAPHQSHEIMPFWAIYPTRNFGVSFSLFSNLGPLVLVFISFIICLFIIYLWRQARKTDYLLHLGFALILSGAIGNLIDRALFGYVIDFIQFHTQTWSFAIFNLADSFITCGAIAILLHELNEYRKSKH